MNIYNGYLEADERKFMIESARIQNEFDKLNTLLEMVMLQEEQAIRDAEFKVFSESGTYDDLTYLVEEVQAETAEKKKGIFTRIFEAIRNLFSKIFFGTKAIRNSQVETVKVPENFEKYADTISKSADSTGNAVANFIKNPHVGAKELVTALGGIIAIGATGKLVATKVKAKKEAEQITGKLEASTNKLSESFKKLTSFLSGPKGESSTKEGQESTNAFSKALQSIRNVIGSIKTGDNKNNNDNNSNNPEKEAYGMQLAKNGVVEKKDKNGNVARIDTTTGKVEYIDKDGNVVSGKNNHEIDKKSQQLKGKAAVALNDSTEQRDRQKVDSVKAKDVIFNKEQTGGANVVVRGATGKVYINGKGVSLNDVVSARDLNYRLRQYGVQNKSVAMNIFKAYNAAQEAIKNSDKVKQEVNAQRTKNGLRALESVEFTDVFEYMLTEAGYDVTIE